jgi:hypothetical protein
MLKNMPGVKPEELDFLGLEDWLKQQKGSVTKAQITDYVRANRIEVKEVEAGTTEPIRREWGQMLGEVGLDGLRTESDVEAARRHNPRFRATTRGMLPTEVLQEAARIRAMPRYKNEAKFGPDKAPKLTLPGGENYRELLLTLPPREELPYVLVAKNNGDLSGLQTRFANRAEAAAYYMALSRDQRFGSEIMPARPDPEFKSSHFDEPNILAHVRMNDRVIDGKKTLLIEEVQSDFGQAFRREQQKVADAIDRDFDSIAAKMVKAGIITKVCD